MKDVNAEKIDLTTLIMRLNTGAGCVLECETGEESSG